MSRAQLGCLDCDHVWYGDPNADTATCPECGSETDLNEQRRQARRAEPEDPPEIVTRQRPAPRGPRG